MIKLAPYPFSLSVLLNANYADGIDTSWIWDADFEQITDMDIPEINAGGVRHSEIARRLRVTGYQLRKSLKQAIWNRFSRPLRTKTANMPISWLPILLCLNSANYWQVVRLLERR